LQQRQDADQVKVSTRKQQIGIVSASMQLAGYGQTIQGYNQESINSRGSPYKMLNPGPDEQKALSPLTNPSLQIHEKIPASRPVNLPANRFAQGWGRQTATR